jgi:DNA processing protein
VEGAQFSGSSITAKLAMDQGREVFAVPGNITSKMSWGPNLLIKQGGKLVQEWNDIVVELRSEDRQRLIIRGQAELALQAEEQGAETQDLSQNPQTIVSKEVLARLSPDTSTQLDDLVETLEYHSSSELIAALFELEMLGLVKQLPGKNFVKVW